MKSRLFALGSLLAILGATTCVGVYNQAHAAPDPAARRLQERHERDRDLWEAIRHLDDAKASINRGGGDYGGHRIKATNACNNAQSEIRAAIEWHRNH